MQSEAGWGSSVYAPDLADRGRTDPPVESAQTKGTLAPRQAVLFSRVLGQFKIKKLLRAAPSGRSSRLSARGTFSPREPPLASCRIPGCYEPAWNFLMLSIYFWHTKISSPYNLVKTGKGFKFGRLREQLSPH